MPSSARIWFARFTAGATFVLVFAGGLVTSTGSALAVPDWPLSYGMLFPPMVGGVFYEHGHRMIAGTVAILTFVLAVWTWRVEARPGVRRLAAAALAAVLVQAVLGGITVLFLLPTPVSVSHACLGQVFFCLVVSLAVVTGRGWTEAVRREARSRSPRPIAVTLVVAVFGQLFLGAWMRHTGAGLAIPDFPLAFGRVVPDFQSAAIAIHFAHRIGAVIVATVIFTNLAVVLRLYADEPALIRPSVALAALVLVQIALGGFTIWSGRAPLPATAHVATGAAILATSVVLALRSFRSLEPRREHVRELAAAGSVA